MPQMSRIRRLAKIGVSYNKSHIRICTAYRAVTLHIRCLSMHERLLSTINETQMFPRAIGVEGRANCAFYHCKSSCLFVSASLINMSSY